MKKENKKIAQQRRAEERKKQARKNIITNICKIGIPSLLLLGLIVLCIANPFEKSDNNTNDIVTEGTSSGDSTTDTTANNAETSTLSTDTSLAVKNGDTVNIDYVGSIDGVEFAGGNTQGAGADLVIGSHTYIDDFEEQLIGAHPGDEVDVNVTFPENYGNEELNGKDALFKVVVNGIYK